MPQAGQGHGGDDLNCCFLNLLICFCDVLIASTVVKGSMPFHGLLCLLLVNFEQL